MTKPIFGLGALRAGQAHMMWRIGLCAVLTAIIFAFDSFYIVSPAISVLYIVPLLLVANVGGSSWVVPWASLCAALTIIAFIIGLPLSLGSIVLPNLIIGLIAISVTAYQLLRSARMRRQLRIDERRYRGIFNTLAVAIWECDFRPVEAAIAELRRAGIEDLRSYVASHPEFVARVLQSVPIIDVNETALRLLGVPSKDAFFRFLGDFVPDEDSTFGTCIIAIDERQPLFQAQTFVRTAQGDKVEVIVAFGLGIGPLDRVPNSVLNISEQSRLTALIADTKSQLANVQQSAILGQISAFIAHEVDQPLTAIQTSTSAALRWLRPARLDPAEATASLHMIGQAAQRAKDVIQRIRSLVGKSQTQSIPLEIDVLVQDATSIVHNDIVAHETRIAHKLRAAAVVRADRILLQQVCVNLIRNALQAMSETPPDRRLLTIESDLADGYVIVRVSDAGPGWPEEIRSEAFQAFRTTKASGMGLGLSICRTIIEAHAGRIRIDTAEGGGACVEFSLPVETGVDGLDEAGPLAEIQLQTPGDRP